MDDVNFECTQCGRCCHGLKLPLTVDEAIAWLDDGHDVQVLCDAVPWPGEPADSDGPAHHKRRRSFAATSGALPTRVVAILAASFAGACPNLGADRRCGIYARRPLVCRIYPAEINPFIALDPAGKACPPDAWTPERAPLLRGGMLVDAAAHALVVQSRASDEREVGIKERVCAALGLDAAALANEGFVIHAPPRAALLDALRAARAGEPLGAGGGRWRIVSNRRATLANLAACGAAGESADSGIDQPFEYLGFHAAGA